MFRRIIAGIDVHKKMLAVVVRRQEGGQVTYVKRKFGTTRSEIEHLAAWLNHEGVEEVVMESTAQYWRPVWYGLEPHFRLHLSHPLKTKAPRGRKRDYRDAQRLADRWFSGDLEESFVPLTEQRSWRWMTRARVDLKRKVTRVRNQVEGVLEEGGIKLSSVASDVFGVSGWAMLELIADGETNVEVLAGEARAVLRNKKDQLKEALAGYLGPAYRMLLKQYLDQVRLLRKQVQELDKEIALAMKDYTEVLCRLCKVPGIQLEAAQDLLAEIGPGAAAFPSAPQFASWVGVCPGCQESAEVCYSRRSAKGNRYLRRVLTQVAWAAIRSKDNFFGSLFARLLPRIESKGAAWAVAHRIAKVVWLLMHEGVEYKEQGPGQPSIQSLNRKLRRMAKQFAAHGLDISDAIAQINAINQNEATQTETAS
jgi:transposase